MRHTIACALLALGFGLHAPSTLAAEATPFVIGALGDSITAGFDAQRIGDNRELSWAAGSSKLVKSHARRLGELLGRPVDAFNESVAGAMAADIDEQVSRLLPHKPDYVTLAIGANDVCTWTSDFQPDLQAFEKDLRTELTRLVKALPNVKIMLAPIPDVYNLWTVASKHSGCQTKWDLIGMCSPLLSSDASAADRAAFVTRWEAANAAITSVANEFSENVRHDPRVSDTKFSWEHVSTIDCFHPSVAGQNLLAEVTWYPEFIKGESEVSEP